MRGVGVRGLVPMLLCVATRTPAGAQSAIPLQKIQIEVRGDVISAASTVFHAGVGASIPAGIYTRIGLVGGVGGGNEGFDARADLFTRFSFDPFRESRWGPYAAAGVSQRFSGAEGKRSRTYLLLILGSEGPLSSRGPSGWSPAVELGLGGGFRIGIVLRQGITGRR